MEREEERPEEHVQLVQRPRRIYGTWNFASLNSRLESNQEEESGLRPSDDGTPSKVIR